MNSYLIVLIVLISGSTCLTERFYAAILRSCPEIQCNGGSKETEMSKVSNCRCDQRCKYHGDCCADSIVAKNSTAPVQLVSSGNCVTYSGTPKGIRIVNTCVQSKEPMPFLRPFCRDAGNTLEQVSRPLKKVPITNLKNGISYANFFCAACNGHDLKAMSDHFAFWPIQSRCGTMNETIQFPVKDMDLSLPEVEDKYKFNEDLGLWQLPVNGRWENCTLVPTPPGDNMHPVTESLRECDPGITNIVSNCSLTNVAAASKCPGYQALVRSLDNVYYRNKYCAECNGVDVSSIHCVGYPIKTISTEEPIEIALESE